MCYSHPEWGPSTRSNRVGIVSSGQSNEEQCFNTSSHVERSGGQTAGSSFLSQGQLGHFKMESVWRAVVCFHMESSAPRCVYGFCCLPRSCCCRVFSFPLLTPSSKGEWELHLNSPEPFSWMAVHRTRAVPFLSSRTQPGDLRTR